jgi:hypothetical protein
MNPAASPLRRIFLVLLVALASCAATAGTAAAKVTWTADGEQAQSKEWASSSCASDSRVKRVSSPVAQGSHAYQLEVRDGDDSWGERCELGMGNPGGPQFPVMNSGDERWFSFQVYLPDDYPINTPDWNLFFQVHQIGDGGCPPISLSVEDGKFKLHNSARKTYVTDTVEKWSAPATRNRWVKFTMHLKNSTSDSVGFVELYGDLDGQGVKELMPREYMHTMTQRANGTAMENHLRVGMYRNPTIRGTTHILFDGFTIGTDQASVEANAFGSGDSAAGSDNGAAAPQPQPQAKRRAKVWLRSQGGVARAAGADWPNLVNIYGGVRRSGKARRSVIIEIRRNGRWEWMNRGRLRKNGRFYIAVSIDPEVTGTVKLRARVPGVGRSGVITAKV